MKHNSYTISDASRKMNMEAHVLRYWEEELKLEIPRNELGHRYYRDKDIQTFTHIKRLKDEGLSLHDIRALIPKLTKLNRLDQSTIDRFKNALPTTDIKTIDTKAAQIQPDGGDKLNRFREIMDSIISQAITNNNEQLASMICENTSDRIMKEMNYLFRTLDEDEDVRFTQLQAAINAAIGVKKDIAASDNSVHEKKRRFGKKNSKKNAQI